MYKTLFRLAFVACLAVSGCASPLRLFSKKPQSYDDFLAQRKAEEKERVATSSSLPNAAADVSELLSKGHAAFQQGAFSEAQTNYLAVLQKQPNQAVANHHLAVIADRQQDFATAEKHYLTALSATPHDADLLNDIGYSYLLQARYADAERYLQLALQKNPKQAKAINNLGMIYGKQGHYDRALALFRQTSSEAEAQAKLSKIVQTDPTATAPAGPMISNNFGATPTNAFLNTDATLPNGATVTPNAPNTVATVAMSSAVPQPGAMSAANPTASAPATDNPNLTDATRQLKAMMEQRRLAAVAERQADDEAERNRIDTLLRQVRSEEMRPTNVGSATGSLLNGENGFTQNATTVPNEPIYIGPSPSNSGGAPIQNQTTQPQTGFVPSQPFQTNSQNAVASSSTIPQPPAGTFGGSSVPPTGLSMGQPSQSNWPIASSSTWPQNPAAPQRDTTLLPSGATGFHSNPTPPPRPVASQGLSVPNGFGTSSGLNPPPISRTNNAATGSPLDTMPIWPPAESLPSLPSNPATSAISANSASIPNVSWPNMQRPSRVDDATRQASQWGMHVGPGNLFPITPGPASQPTRSISEPNASQQSNGFTQNGPRNWPTNTTQPASGPAFATPTSRPYGQEAFNTAPNPQTMLPSSTARAALQDQVPPSGQYQTPTAFGLLSSPNNPPVQPAIFSQNRAQPMSYRAPSPIQQANELERAGTRSTVPDRFGGDDRWEQAPSPTGSTPIRSAPTNQGFIATSSGDNALSEYERMVQMHNAELNSIRQQLDTQRQQPASELYFRSTTQPQMGTPTGTDQRFGSPAGATPGQSPMNAPGR